jgi:hypothetical protein
MQFKKRKEIEERQADCADRSYDSRLFSTSCGIARFGVPQCTVLFSYALFDPYHPE